MAAASAISGAALIVSGIKLEVPKTAELAGILKAANTGRGTLMAVATVDRNLLLSGRNIPGFSLKLIAELNAYDVLRARNLVFTPEAFEALRTGNPAGGGSAEA